MRTLLLSTAIFAAGLCAGVASSETVMGQVDRYAQQCDRAPLPDATGHYQARGLLCQLADKVTGEAETGRTKHHDVNKACELADAMPTDANLEACFGLPVEL